MTLVEEKPTVVTLPTGQPAGATATAAAVPSPSAQRGFGGFKQDVYTLGDEGQVILQWPEQMSQGSYDEFVDWIELQLRKIARVNKLEPKKKPSGE